MQQATATRNKLGVNPNIEREYLHFFNSYFSTSLFRDNKEEIILEDRHVTAMLFNVLVSLQDENATHKIDLDRFEIIALIKLITSKINPYV